MIIIIFILHICIEHLCIILVDGHGDGGRYNHSYSILLCWLKANLIHPHL